MQSTYAQQFEREMACSVQDWLRWLPAAIGSCPCVMQEGGAHIQVGQGTLCLRWSVLTPLSIALVRLPRLKVGFEFAALNAVQRQVFMQRFDLYLQRGGG